MRRRKTFSAMVGVWVLLMLGLGAGCSSRPTATPVPQGLRGEYDIAGFAGVGALAQITFLDAQHYEALTTNDTDEPDKQEGTYVLNLSAGTLALTDSATGKTKTMPFRADVSSAGGPMMTSDGLEVLGGTSLVNSDASLTTGTTSVVSIQVICKFTVNTTTFQLSSLSCVALNSAGVSLRVDAGLRLTDGSLSLLGDAGSARGEAGVTLVSDGGTQCAPVTFPSGVAIATVADPATTASYASHLVSPSFPLPQAPTCFIDMTKIIDSKTGNTLQSSVMVSASFSLSNVAYGNSGAAQDRFVTVDPGAVAALEQFKTLVGTGGTVAVYSGFRSASHQTSVCQSICGASSCAQNGLTTCAKASQHMFGDAFDLTDARLLSAANQQLACQAGFRFSYSEQNHLHIDTWPRGTATCLEQTL